MRPKGKTVRFATICFWGCCCFALVSGHAGHAQLIPMSFGGGPLAVMPSNPTTLDTVVVVAPLDGEVHSNSCFAAAALGGTPHLDIDTLNHSIDIVMVGPAPVVCPLDFDPVSGALSEPFGPLAAGNWVVHNSHGGSLPFTVTLLGDMNRDRLVNGLDVDPFVDVLTQGPFDVAADMNRDGAVNGLDVDPFVAALVGGGTQQIPEPSTLLLCIVALGVVGRWRRWRV
jgi:hypothetical protein